MSTNFYAILPSSTPYKGDTSGVNKPNKFKIHLPRTLVFDGVWQAGLAAISYPRTWPMVGSLGRQHVVIKFKDGRKCVCPIPEGNPSNEKELSNFLNKSIINETLRVLSQRFVPSRRKREAIRSNPTSENLTSDTNPPSKKTPHEIKIEKKNRLIFLENESKKLIGELAEETIKINAELNLDEKSRKISLRGTNAANIINLFVEALDILDPDRGYLGPADVEQYNERKQKYLQAKIDINQSQVALEREVNEAIKTRQASKKTAEPKSSNNVTNGNSKPSLTAEPTIHDVKLQKKNRLILLENESKDLMEKLAAETVKINEESNLEEKSLRSQKVSKIIAIYVEALDLLDTERGNLGPADVEQYAQRKTMYMQAKSSLKQSQETLEKDVKDAKIEERKQQAEKERRESEIRQQEENTKREESEKQAEKARKESEIRPQEENNSPEQVTNIKPNVVEEQVETTITEVVEFHEKYDLPTEHIRKDTIYAVEKYENIFENTKAEIKVEEKSLEKGIKEDGFYFPSYVTDEEISDALNSLKFNFLESMGKFEVRFSEKIDSVQLSYALNYTLGFQEGRFLENGEQAKRMPDLRGGIDQLYVYTNICSDMLVGNKETNLIRNVCVSGKPGEIIEKIYDTPILNRILHHHRRN